MLRKTVLAPAVSVVFALAALALITQVAYAENGMVLVKGGCFSMGAGDGNPDERPAHEVCMDDFFMDKHEVTQKAYMEAMGANPSHFKDCGDCPVENVKWGQAKEYCEKLGKRLPTEAEWEYAAKGGGKDAAYPGTGKALDESAWYRDNSSDKTHPVGLKKPNSLGLYDMGGNVNEWVADIYGENYYKASPKDNPKGPESGEARILRGGSWFCSSEDTRASDRVSSTPDSADFDFGFRCAKSK